MITTTFNLMKMDKIEPLDDQSVFETDIPPLQRVKDFSDEAFEEFIAEWAVACAKTKYKDVYRIGGAGDKGRDVIAEHENGTFDYYQCKKYSGQLQPSQYWIEFGKLCYFIYNKDIPMPEKYYIIASHDLSKKMRTLLENKENIRTGLMKEWDDKCSKNLIEKKTITLSDDLLRFIQEFDFNIVDTYSINTIIEEHRHTHYFYFRYCKNSWGNAYEFLSCLIHGKEIKCKMANDVFIDMSEADKNNKVAFFNIFAAFDNFINAIHEDIFHYYLEKYKVCKNENMKEEIKDKIRLFSNQEKRLRDKLRHIFSELNMTNSKGFRNLNEFFDIWGSKYIKVRDKIAHGSLYEETYDIGEVTYTILTLIFSILIHVDLAGNQWEDLIVF